MKKANIMSRREPTEEEKRVLENLADLSRRGVPVDYPDCPKSGPGRKWRRGLPLFLNRRSLPLTQKEREELAETR
jgi:hypothetical protein